MERHDGRGVVISGGTSGIGLACARRLHEEGARVWVLGTSEATVAGGLAQLPEGVRGSVCDVSDEHAVESVVAEAAAAFGRIDVAVCNAGIDGQGVERARPRRRDRCGGCSTSTWSASSCSPAPVPG